MGWNFTEQNDGSNDKNKRVSIPNRMKFYPARNESRRLLFQVSIPNGMEFYTILVWLIIVSVSFNSQRDGILLKLYSFYKLRSLVSIPNGMEFYIATVLTDRREHVAFQFPTGWNSTPHSFLQIEYLYRFNSQWDGILP